MYNCSFLRWNNIHGESDIMQDLGGGDFKAEIHGQLMYAELQVLYI
jgi:hypothetical protein